MKWLFRRILVFWVVTSIFCMVVVALARSDGTPTRLQALGFAICDGGPCFRGIKPGASLATAQKLFPDAVMSYDGLQMNNVGDLPTVIFHPSTDNATIESIWLPSFEFDPPQPFTLADVIVQYGSPCHVVMYYGDTGPYFLDVIYPKMHMSVETQFNTVTDEIYDSHRLQWHYPVKGFVIGEPSQGGCNEPIAQTISWWHGFKSEEEYHRYSLQDLGITEP